MDHNKASSSRYSCRFPKIFFYEAHRRYPDRSLTAPSSLLKYAIPGDNDKPYLPQLYERLPEALPLTPRKPIIAEQGDPLPPTEALAPARVEEVPEDVRQNWHTALESFLKEYQSYPVNQNFVINPSLLSALPCYWPLVRMTLNAKGAINTWSGKWAWTYGPHPPCTLLSKPLWHTNELPHVTSAKEWERLSSEEFWIHALLSESCRFNRELAKAANTKDETKYQRRGVVNMQAMTDVNNPALTTPPTASTHAVCRLPWCRALQTHDAALHDEQNAPAGSRFSPNGESLYHTATWSLSLSPPLQPLFGCYRRKWTWARLLSNNKTEFFFTHRAVIKARKAFFSERWEATKAEENPKVCTSWGPSGVRNHVQV